MDNQTRALERKAVTGDPEAIGRLNLMACRRGEHKWDNCSCCTVCKVTASAVDAIMYDHQLRIKREAQKKLCVEGKHDWVPGDEIAEECGCPSDPGIHGCHPRFCWGCGIPEFPDEEEICGLCEEPGADKMAVWTGGGVYWPGERRPETEMVHAECEQEETRRAHSELSQEQIDAVHRSIRHG